MSTVNVNFRLESSEKKQVEAFCNEIGMNLTTLLTIFIKYINHNQKLPFELSLSRKSTSPNPINFEKYRTGKNYFKSAEEIDQYIKELRNDERI